jgi:hypothetical protein
LVILRKIKGWGFIVRLYLSYGGYRRGIREGIGEDRRKGVKI